ncbi:autotransporter outer membrane beta-barrel domain-containing protein, partial [candidate division KSB1 bacterium]|nr:autotransporter outer membrane beta-barrel domain-containing protein [candidate division KSB1 bacterium]
VRNAEDIITTGAAAHGIFAQSIGGGGGSGANGIIGTGLDVPFLDDILTLWDPTAFGALTVGGSGNACGNGAAVDITHSGQIITSGYASHGIFAQSIGGGGGTAQNYAHGGNAAVGLLGIVNLGGSGGASGDGGSVSVICDGSIHTSGNMAFGIFAQSIGGGGGMAGDVVRGLGDLDVGIGLGFGGNGTNGGDGGDVTVDNSSDITTLGDGAIGLFAQSVGGGGGLGGGAGNLGQSAALSFAGSVGGFGSAGAVNVTQKGAITTAGKAAHGILVQCAGGDSGVADFGGPVMISVLDNILTYGDSANGIMVQSVGSEGNGNISIDILSGMIQGGAEFGTGILMLDGADNLLSNHGTITTMKGVDGFAIRGTGGNETVDNFGIVTGSVDLGDGVNLFNNHAGSVFEAGQILTLGPKGVLTNEGVFSPGGAHGFMTTTLNCDFVQTGAGTYEASVCGSRQDKLIMTDGTAALNGTLKIVAECDVYTDGTTYDILEGPDVIGNFNNVILPNTAFLDFDLNYIGSGVRLSVDVKEFSSTADNPVERSIACCMDCCKPDATGDMENLIGALQLTMPDQVEEGFASLSPGAYDNLLHGRLQSAYFWQNTLTQRMDEVRFLSSRGNMTYGRKNSIWFGGAQQGADQDKSGGYLGHQFMTSGSITGYERSLGSSIIGLCIGSLHTDVGRRNNTANARVDGIAGSVYAGHAWGRSFVHGALCYADERFENRRDVHVGPLERIALSDYQGSTWSVVMTGGRRFSSAAWGFEPFVSMRYAKLSEEGFTEKGAGSANLTVKSRTTDWLISDLGFRLSRNFLKKRSAFVPELLLSWYHDFAIDDCPIIAAFEGSPSTTFKINGQDIQRDGITMGTGISYISANGWKAGFRYVRMQRSDFQANSLVISLGSMF